MRPAACLVSTIHGPTTSPLTSSFSGKRDGLSGSCWHIIHVVSCRMEKLVVEEGASFSVFLKLHNKGENARNVKLFASYSTGLSFRKANITEVRSPEFGVHAVIQ